MVSGVFRENRKYHPVKRPGGTAATLFAVPIPKTVTDGQFSRISSPDPGLYAAQQQAGLDGYIPDIVRKLGMDSENRDLTLRFKEEYA